MPLCLEMLHSVGIPVIAEDGVEADDLLATVARHLAVERGDWEVRTQGLPGGAASVPVLSWRRLHVRMTASA